jgi:hypothetical protein
MLGSFVLSLTSSKASRIWPNWKQIGFTDCSRHSHLVSDSGFIVKSGTWVVRIFHLSVDAAKIV